MQTELIHQTDAIFFRHGELDESQIFKSLGTHLHRADDGELYLEYGRSEFFTWTEGRLQDAGDTLTEGFGLRGVFGERTGYAYSGALTPQALQKSGQAVKTVGDGWTQTSAAMPARTNRAVYRPDDPLMDLSKEHKIALLSKIDAFVRSRSSSVQQVTIRLAGSWRAVQILRPDQFRVADIRPLVSLSVSVIASKDGRREEGSMSCGGREPYHRFLEEENWKTIASEALRQAEVNLEARPAPAGEMPVVLGPGWPGILLHEAVGHGLEGDFNRKSLSLFSGQLGEKVASSAVTVVDDGTLEHRRGSLSVDDEGTPTGRTVLIQDGVLKAYMQDRQNARLMKMAPTGNGRRESFCHAPMPRMTNTFMTPGAHDPSEIIGSVSKGLYAVSFGGGQVDITNGNFVFTCTEAYQIENGRVTHPVKGATLIGNGPDVMTKVSMVGTDFALDGGMGTCGKNGQGVPVGVGQPTVRIDAITVGGTS